MSWHRGRKTLVGKKARPSVGVPDQTAKDQSPPGLDEKGGKVGKKNDLSRVATVPT